jgi:ribosomal protein L11 methyltransferase
MKKEKFWTSLLIPVNPPTGEAISAFLLSSGATGIVEQNGGIQAFFPGSMPVRPLKEEVVRYLHALRDLGFETHPDRIAFETIDDRDWNSEWKKSYHGFSLGERIFIKPSWEALPTQPYECLIEIDPEMAFGSGTHATTRLCLLQIEKLVHGGERVLDIGTGTGILAIAAAKLGAATVTAFDIDPIAAETCVKNAIRNGVRSQISIYTGTLHALRSSAHWDIVLANVNRNEIFKLLPLMQKVLHYSVELVLSGILAEEAEAVNAAVTSQGFHVIETVHSEEWVACRATPGSATNI